ncbi:hypothetical protein HDF17_000308 [Granulicella arctica]|uniref:Uncharacterized protein n=1 Tax=Granulicella arctica TaxID=940613 RepID=A0A7Y9PF51_9BACT|nr:hypothetical protein [Granulicella arctica]
MLCYSLNGLCAALYFLERNSMEYGQIATCMASRTTIKPWTPKGKGLNMLSISLSILGLLSFLASILPILSISYK